jgi:hypothetical protein
MLLLAEGQTGEAWEPSKEQRSFGNWAALDNKYFHFLSSLNG